MALPFNENFVGLDIEITLGFGFICFTSEEAANKAKEEFDKKNLHGYENSKRQIIISDFMPKNERRQYLNKLQDNQNTGFPFQSGQPFPAPYMVPMPPRHYQNRPHKANYKKLEQHQKEPNQIPLNQINVNNSKEEEPNLEYLNSLDNIEAQKDYLGEFLFKKIEQLPISQKKNLTVETISKITSMILVISDIKEIFDITTNNESITQRINEALNLLEGS